MANLLWNESSPADTDSAGAGDDEIRSLKTSIRNGLAAEHAWPSATGSGFGVHLLGSARAYYDVQSNVSSAGTDGRLLVTSDSSRLFHVGSAGTSFIGGNTVISAGSQPVGGQRFYWAEEFGEALANQGASTHSVTVSFPNSGFSGVPFVTASAWTTGTTQKPVAIITGLTATSVQFQVYDITTGGTSSKCTVIWRSTGTRTF